MPDRARVLILTDDVVTPAMAGPAIRAWEIASHLALQQPVRLLVQDHSDVRSPGFELDRMSDRRLAEGLDWADVVLFQGFVASSRPSIFTSGKVLVCDLYDPFHLENLELYREEPASRRTSMAASDLGILVEQLRRADFFLCASERQRDFWLGHLAGAGRVNPLTYDDDQTLRTLIDLAPFGIQGDPPQREGPAIRGLVPGIGPEDPVILWGGGVYDWLDPLSAIRAVDVLRRGAHPEIRLFFLGLSHPNPGVPPMRMVAKTVELARELGLEGRHVFFNQGWVPYERRADYLLDSTIGISCHLDHVEAAFSYRTRVLDYLWAGLPSVVTRGDSLSEVIAKSGAGLTVPPGDVDALADAIGRLLSEDAVRDLCRANIESLRRSLSWESVLGPLQRFCANPQHAPDLASEGTVPLDPRPFGSLLARARRVWGQGGWSLLSKRARHYLRRRIG